MECSFLDFKMAKEILKKYHKSIFGVIKNG